jgi:transcriptional regulator with XRE-family HTH domain
MLYQIQAKVYTSLRRDAAGLTQYQLAKVSGVPRGAIQRIEQGRRLPTREEEEAVRQATGCTRRFFAELICKALADELETPVSIGAGPESDDPAATPEAEAYGLLLAGKPILPASLWWSWKGRLGRVRALGLWLEQELLGIVAELRALLLTFEAKEEKPDETGEPTG